MVRNQDLSSENFPRFSSTSLIFSSCPKLDTFFYEKKFFMKKNCLVKTPQRGEAIWAHSFWGFQDHGHLAFLLLMCNEETYLMTYKQRRLGRREGSEGGEKAHKIYPSKKCL